MQPLSPFETPSTISLAPTAPPLAVSSAAPSPLPQDPPPPPLVGLWQEIPEETPTERPIKPCNSFILFRRERARGDPTQMQRSRVLGAQWKALSPHRKLPYEACAAVHQKAYFRKLALWVDYALQNGLPTGEPKKKRGRADFETVEGCGEGQVSRQVKRLKTAGYSQLPFLSPCTSASSSRASSAMGMSMPSTPSTFGGGMLPLPYPEFDPAFLGPYMHIPSGYTSPWDVVPYTPMANVYPHPFAYTAPLEPLHIGTSYPSYPPTVTFPSVASQAAPLPRTVVAYPMTPSLEEAIAEIERELWTLNIPELQAGATSAPPAECGPSTGTAAAETIGAAGFEAYDFNLLESLDCFYDGLDNFGMALFEGGDWGENGGADTLGTQEHAYDSDIQYAPF